MIPPSNKLTPNHDNRLKYSPTKKTPNNAAVSGSAKLSVTAADELIFFSPAKNNKYATLVAASNTNMYGQTFTLITSAISQNKFFVQAKSRIQIKYAEA